MPQLLETLKSRIYKKFEQRFKAFYDRYDKTLPQISLSETHIQNLKVLPHRISLLQHIPQGGIGAEVGVDRGDFSLNILKYVRPQKLHLVDAWHSERYHTGLRQVVEERLAEALATGQVEIHQGLSVERAQDFEEASLDWIYLDAGHSYQAVHQDLYAYVSKIKPGGLIMGHDYVLGNWNGLVRYGVIDAVHEFCVKENWEMVYLTIDALEQPSFALKKL